jgi:hypothetical protein
LDLARTARNRRSSSGTVAGLVLLEHIDHPSPTAHIEATAFGIHEHIVGIAAGFHFRCGVSRRTSGHLGVPAGPMKGVGGGVALAAAAMLTCWAGAARAYRPFDGTDAAVAETGEMEIELGPVEYLRDGADRTLLAPDLRINYGFGTLPACRPYRERVPRFSNSAIIAVASNVLPTAP